MLLAQNAAAAETRPIIIAHRGASGYLPEHTLAAKALAYGQDADFLEQDVVLTRDDQPIVLHDIHLDTVTNVAQAFPDRVRTDGRYYAIDLTLAEIRSLRVTERVDWRTGRPVFPGRFPAGKSDFRVPTLAEEIELIQGLNHSTGRSVGIYTEVKAPSWHRQQGKDISRIVVDVLRQYGYREKSDAAFVQCFEPAETKRIRTELNCGLRLIQLIGGGAAEVDFERMRTPAGLAEIAQYADGIGPSLDHVVRGRDPNGQLILSPLVADAHRCRLLVHPYTLRADALPKYAATFEELVRIFFVDAGVDGVFTDFPDRTLWARDEQ